MASDFKVIFGGAMQFGVNSHMFDDQSVFNLHIRGSDIEFVGPSREFAFETPGVDVSSESILSFSSYDVTYGHNALAINGTEVTNGIPSTAVRGEWRASQLILPAGTLLPQGSNTLFIEAANAGSKDEPIIENFVISKMVLMYRLIGSN
jgi:hypothetical protein